MDNKVFIGKQLDKHAHESPAIKSLMVLFMDGVISPSEFADAVRKQRIKEARR